MNIQWKQRDPDSYSFVEHWNWLSKKTVQQNWGTSANCCMLKAKTSIVFIYTHIICGWCIGMVNALSNKYYSTQLSLWMIGKWNIREIKIDQRNYGSHSKVGNLELTTWTSLWFAHEQESNKSVSSSVEMLLLVLFCFSYTRFKKNYHVHWPLITTLKLCQVFINGLVMYVY